MQANRFSLSAKFAAVAAALALGGSAFAASGSTTAADSAAPAAASAPAEHGAKHHWSGHHHKRGHKHMRDAGMWVPGYGPLSKTFIASLSLTDAQNKLIDEARSEQAQLRKNRFEHRKESHSDRMDQVKSGKIDPKEALASREKAAQQARADRAKIDDKWLAVWDALDAAQQEKIGQHFAERAEKFAKRAEARKERHAERKSQKQDEAQSAKPIAS